MNEEDLVSEERTHQHHPQEPAEGSDEDVEAAGSQRAGETDKTAEGTGPSGHPEEPAEVVDQTREIRYARPIWLRFSLRAVIATAKTSSATG